jgi:hypothetical protein
LEASISAKFIFGKIHLEGERIMRKLVSASLAIALALAFLALPMAKAMAAPKAKYSADVPDSVKTPDKVETKSLGTLEFFDGMPSPETVKKVYDNLDLTRGVTAFLDGIPIASMYAMLRGLREAGVAPGEVGISETLLDARSLLLTPNTTTIYILAQIDLSDGPVVLDAPPSMLGLIDDAAFRYVIDVGQLGPDKGKGGKFLFVPPGYKGDIPDGYFVAKSRTFDHWVALRASVKDGDTATPVKMIKQHLNIYPLSQAGNPPAETFHDLSGKQFNTIHANNFEFYEELDHVVQKEPADAFDPERTGTFASIGIKKGQPFKPDARMKKLLTEAAAIGNATARALTFNPRKKSVFFYEDRKWTSPFAGGSHEFFDKGERVLDDRTFFHYLATGITPAMASSAVGKGSAYAAAAMDSKGQYLDGGKTYKVTLPKPVPAKNFWSFMVYSGQHRSILETDQKTGGVDSKSPDIKPNEDGSYTVWFSPIAPKGHEGNWVQTVPGKSFNVLFRLYGPLEPWFDKSWKPGDFEQVK